MAQLLGRGIVHLAVVCARDHRLAAARGGTAGLDPVMLTDAGETVAGRREHGVVYRKRVYLFSSEDSLERFWQDPERFASPIRQAMESGDVGRLFR